jgi:hypothetical protein
MIRTIFQLALFLVLALGVGSALAWDGVEVTSAYGYVDHLIYGSASPEPYPCYWRHGDSPDLFFHVTNGEAGGMPDVCEDPWLAHCDNDSLTFQGAWPQYQSWTTNFVEYVVDLSCTVTITATTRLTARRSVISESVSPNEHYLTLTHPDGSTQPLLADEAGPDHAQLILPPGLYEATLHVWAGGYRIPHTEFILPYEGWVSLLWEDPDSVGVEPIVWSSVKALYRQGYFLTTPEPGEHIAAARNG